MWVPCAGNADGTQKKHKQTLHITRNLLEVKRLQYLSRSLKLRHEIALQPKLSENASSQIGSGSQKLLEI